MKLNYRAKRIITTADLYDACDPPLTFEVRVRPSHQWAILYREFEDGDAKDVESARTLIAMSFLTVSDGENTYPMDKESAVADLQAAVEASNPGYGGEFICNIAWAFGRNHYSFLVERLGNSLEPSLQSNGSDGDKTLVKVS